METAKNGRIYLQFNYLVYLQVLVLVCSLMKMVKFSVIVQSKVGPQQCRLM